MMFPTDSSFDSYNYNDPTAADWNSSLLDTLKAADVHKNVDIKTDLEQTPKFSLMSSANNSENELNKLRSGSSNSDFYDIDVNKDLKCNVKGCACDKVNKNCLEDKSKCNTEQSGAGNVDLDVTSVHGNVGKGLCNDKSKADKSDVFHTKKPNDLDIKPEGCSEDLGKTVEELSDDHGDVTPVMTDSTSTLCDQLSVITNVDNSTTEKVHSDKQSEDLECKLEQTKDGGSSVRNMSLEQNIDIGIENKLKGRVIHQTVAQSEISSDSGLDIHADNINDKQTSLDFGSISDKGSDVDFGEKLSESNSEGFTVDHNKHGYTVGPDVRASLGTSDCKSASAMDAKKRKWKFMHPFKYLLDGESSVGKYVFNISVCSIL